MGIIMKGGYGTIITEVIVKHITIMMGIVITVIHTVLRLGEYIQAGVEEDIDINISLTKTF
jgi:hypothetical protein